VEYNFFEGGLRIFLDKPINKEAASDKPIKEDNNNEQ